MCLRLSGGRFPKAPDEAFCASLLKADKKIRKGIAKIVLLKAPEEPVLFSLGPESFESLKPLLGGESPEGMPPELLAAKVLLFAAKALAQEAQEGKLLPYDAL
jgi:hypothetical protein